MLKISQRLLAMAKLIPPGSKVADIGTDHALLPCYLVKKGIAAAVIGVDVHKGPYQSAWRMVQACGLQNTVDVRLGDGLRPIGPGEVDAIIIAGMGGGTIRDILQEASAVLEHVNTLIFQPMNGAELVRHWLQQKEWMITFEDMLIENGRQYIIIKAEPGYERPLDEMEALYGPRLIERKHPLLVQQIQKDVESWQDIIQQLAKSSTEEAKEKVLELQNRIGLAKELKEWLLSVRT